MHPGEYTPTGSVERSADGGLGLGQHDVDRSRGADRVDSTLTGQLRQTAEGGQQAGDDRGRCRLGGSRLVEEARTAGRCSGRMPTSIRRSAGSGELRSWYRQWSKRAQGVQRTGSKSAARWSTNASARPRPGARSSERVAGRSRRHGRGPRHGGRPGARPRPRVSRMRCGTANAPHSCTTMPGGTADHLEADSARRATWRKPLSSRWSSMRDRTRW